MTTISTFLYEINLDIISSYNTCNLWQKLPSQTDLKLGSYGYTPKIETTIMGADKLLFNFQISPNMAPKEDEMGKNKDKTNTTYETTDAETKN